MTLSELGLHDSLLEKYSVSVEDRNLLARVIQEHKESYIVQNSSGILRAEITGNLRYAAESRLDFPAVGDWVMINVVDSDNGIIYKILPRYSQLERQSVGTYAEKQLMATNIDFAFIVQALDRDFNLNRLERYFVMANNGNIQPIVILNKADLLDESSVTEIKAKVYERLNGPSLFVTTTMTCSGLDILKAYIKAGKTYCFLGSSGVGKSSIINFLLQEKQLDVKEISTSTNKGKHTTTHRELIVLENGGILIDTPGMREVGLTEGETGLEKTFSKINKLAEHCKFADCTHVDEPGCKVLEAIDEGIISLEAYENYKKIEKQEAHFSATIADKRKKEKSFGKMLKEVMKHKKKYKHR
jgi:ribosome biogenesis GTPase